MDKLDQQLLRILRENSRAKASDISRQINLSVSAVIDRIHRFEDRGIITRYTVALDYNALGYGIRAWLHVQLEQPRYADAFAARMQHTENILSCDYLTGEFDFLLQAVARSTQELDLLQRAVSDVEGVAAVKTHVVLREHACDVPI